MGRVITIATSDGDFSAYVAVPSATASIPIVIVIQEAFGVNADQRATCDNFAAHGYLAICPDLFWRLEPGVDITDQTDAEWRKALALYAAFDIDSGVADIAATIQSARSLSGVSGRVGVVGFCLGGLLAFLSAVRIGLDAAVAYYGRGIDKYIGEADRLPYPLLLHFAEQDELILKHTQEIIVSALKNNPMAEIQIYPNCANAFARHGGKDFDATVAKQANDRTLAFLQANLH